MAYGGAAVNPRYWKPANDFLGAELEPATGLPHLHDEWQFAVPSQAGSLLVGAYSHGPARAGDITVVPPYDVHGESAGGSWRMLFVARRLVSLDPHSRIVPDPAAGAELAALLHQSRDGLVHGSAFEAAALGWLARLTGRLAAGPAARRTRRPRAAVERARALLIQHRAATLRLEEIASAAGVGASHLVRSFSLDVGLPPRSYHAQVRLALARRLLAEGKPATWVAYECGFADQSHLSRRFKESYGLPPGAFQAQCLDYRVARAGSDAA
jgi:AraC-like DNA-binding protein